MILCASLTNFSDQQIETSSRVQILDSGDLLIAAVKENDIGMYTCIRANEAGAVQASAHLGVLGTYTNLCFMFNVLIIILNSILIF